MRRILITNDDGITADGIVRLAKAAKEFGEVWIVAPENQMSAASHSITLRDPIDVYPHDFPVEGVRAFACSGTPADCIRIGVLAVMDSRPDVVLSGINLGYNVAGDIQYSATLGAAFEAAFQNVQAIAFSEGFDEVHEITDRYLKELLAELIERPLPEGMVWNVNFPDGKLSECGGVLYDRTISHHMVFDDIYPMIEELDNGGRRYMVEGEQTDYAEEGTDLRAIRDICVSVGIVANIGY